MTVIRKCDSHRGGMKAIKKVFQLMERCDESLGNCKFKKFQALFSSRIRSIFLGKIYKI